MQRIPDTRLQSRQRRTRSKPAAVVLGALALLAVALGIFHVIWFRWMGEYLVHEEAPVKAGIIVVLGGDFCGDRILEGAKLASEGYAPQVLVSGGGSIYGHHESDLAVDFAVRHGYPEALFIKETFPATSTRDEEEADAKELRRLHVKDFLLVTSSYHTRRASATFRSVAPDLKFRTVGTPDQYFSPTGWWHNREGEKTFVMEWTKTLVDGLGF